MKKIDFVSADDGALILSVDGIDHVCKTPQSAACLLVVYSCFGTHFSSSMDFASEYGFEADGDARAFFSRAEDLARDELARRTQSNVDRVMSSYGLAI